MLSLTGHSRAASVVVLRTWLYPDMMASSGGDLFGSSAPYILGAIFSAGYWQYLQRCRYAWHLGWYMRLRGTRGLPISGNDNGGQNRNFLLHLAIGFRNQNDHKQSVRRVLSCYIYWIVRQPKIQILYKIPIYFCWPTLIENIPQVSAIKLSVFKEHSQFRLQLRTESQSIVTSSI
jgi:hypothetical protein